MSKITITAAAAVACIGVGLIAYTLKVDGTFDYSDRIECIDSAGHRYYEKRQVKVVASGAGLFEVKSSDGKIDDQVSGNCWVARER